METEVAGVGLSPNQLNKYRWRVEKFVDKIFDKESMSLTNGRSIIPSNVTVEGKLYQPDQHTREEVVDAIWNITNFKKIYINGVVGEEEMKVVSSKVSKTADFGGKPSGYETKLEDAMLASVKDQLEIAIDVNLGQPINLVVGPNVYKGVTAAVSTPKTPKSDIHFITQEGEEVSFISHKAGRSSRDFQQYSGVSKFYDHPEVMKFIDDLKDYYGSAVIPRKALLQREISDEELKLKSVYGHEFGCGEYGIDNVNLFIQGDVKLIRVDEMTYRVEGYFSRSNGDVLDGGYDPSLMVSYRSGRINKYIQNGRLGIYPTECFSKKTQKF